MSILKTKKRILDLINDDEFLDNSLSCFSFEHELRRRTFWFSTRLFFCCVCVLSHVDATRRDATRRRRIRDARTERFHLSPRLASPETRARGIIVRGIFCVDSFIHLVLNAELSNDRLETRERTNEGRARWGRRRVRAMRRCRRWRYEP